jgi:cytidylate kinase
MDEDRNYMDGEIYIDLLNKIVPEVADEGNIIILGRGSQFILKGREDTYHVLLVAERDDRVRFMQEQYGLSQEKAREAVDRQGKRREALMRLFKRGDYDDATHYNMVINQSKMDLDMAAELVCEMVNAA